LIWAFLPTFTLRVITSTTIGCFHAFTQLCRHFGCILSFNFATLYAFLNAFAPYFIALSGIGLTIIGLAFTGTHFAIAALGGLYTFTNPFNYPTRIFTFDSTTPYAFLNAFTDLLHIHTSTIITLSLIGTGIIAGTATGSFHPFTQTFIHPGCIFTFNFATLYAFLNAFSSRFIVLPDLILAIIGLGLTTPTSTVIILALGYFHSLFCRRLQFFSLFAGH
jgi:hypothetical protein